jgi:hypothetical protein
MRRLALLLPVLLCACPSISTTDGGTFTVGPEGTKGIVIDTSTGVAIDVPAGAVADEKRITVVPQADGIPEVPGRKRISLGYRFFPNSVTFAVPMKLYLPWDESRLVPGVDPGTYDMRRQTATEPYLALPGTATHTALKVVEAQTDKLGLFWLTSPIEANVSTLTIEPEEVALMVGGTQQFTAEVKDPTGKVLDIPVRWSTIPPRVGHISDGGLFTADDPGTATVTARAGTALATATVRVQGSAPGPTSFIHENPFPTGNDLWGGTVLPGPLGVAFVGANATVLTRDGFGVWKRVFSSPGITLKGIAGTSIENAVAIGQFGTNGVLVEMANNMPRVTTYPFNDVVPDHLWFDGTYGLAIGSGNNALMRGPGGAWSKVYNPSNEPIRAVIGGSGRTSTRPRSRCT